MSCVAGVFYFWIHSQHMAENLSSPSIMILGRTQKGEPIMIDDFRYAYYKAKETYSYGKRGLFVVSVYHDSRPHAKGRTHYD